MKDFSREHIEVDIDVSSIDNATLSQIKEWL